MFERPVLKGYQLYVAHSSTFGYLMAQGTQDHRISIIQGVSSSRTHPVQPVSLSGMTRTLGGFGQCVQASGLPKPVYVYYQTLEIYALKLIYGRDQLNLDIKENTMEKV